MAAGFKRDGRGEEGLACRVEIAADERRCHGIGADNLNRLVHCPDSWPKAGIAVDFETAGAFEYLHLAVARRLGADVIIDGKQIGKGQIGLVLDDVASDAAVSGE